MAEYAIALQSGADTAARWRLAVSGLITPLAGLKSRSGMLDNGAAVTLTSGMSVSVSPFRAVIQGAATTTQGAYLCVLDTTKTLTFADGGGAARTDLIVARVYDHLYDGTGQTKMAVEIVQGATGGGVPATPAGAVKLAEKVIAAGMSAGTGGLGTAPTDRRPPRAAAAGGVAPVVDNTDRDTLARYPGLTVWNMATARLEVCTDLTGNTWAPITAGSTDIGWTNLASPLGIARYQVKSGVVWIHLDGALSTATGVPKAVTTSALPPEYRPTTNSVRQAGYFGGYPGTLTVLSSGLIEGLHQSGTTRGSVAGMLSYPVGT